MKTMSLESRIEDRKAFIHKELEELNVATMAASDDELPVLEAKMEALMEELCELQMYTMGF